MIEQYKWESSKKVFRIFEEGKKFSEDLIKENERLRLANINLRSEMRNIEDQYVKTDVIRMQKIIEFLEKELYEQRKKNQELKEQFLVVEEENRGWRQTYLCTTSVGMYSLEAERRNQRNDFYSITSISRRVVRQE